jgi:hypothetical protein
MELKKYQKVLLIVILTLATICSVAFIASVALEKSIKEKVTTEINNTVTVPVQVKGGITLSLFKHFPYASLTFNDVSIDDKLSKGNRKLLEAKEISLLCNIFSLFGNQIEFSKILIRDGQMNMYRNAAGSNNWDIIKANGSSSNTSIQLSKAEIRRMHYTYKDLSQNIFTDVDINRSVLSGNFSAENFLLKTESKLTVHSVTTGDDKFLQGKNINSDVTLLVDTKKNRFEFKGGKISFDETSFAIEGYFVTAKQGTSIDFKLENKGNDIQKLVALIPEKYKQSFSGADGSGEYIINATFKGLLSSSTQPAIEVNAALNNSEIKLSKYNKFLKKVNAEVKYTSDKSGNNSLEISNFNCTLNNVPFNFKLSLKNLAHPDFDFYANGILHLSEISPFIPDSVLQEIDGSITFEKFHISGNVSDFINVENSNLSGSGTFKLNEVEFRQNGITYGNIGGSLNYREQIITAQNFTLNFLSTDFTFNGRVENLLPFVYNLSTKRTSNNIVLAVNGKVETKLFNLTSILDAFDKKNRSTVQQREKVNIRDIFNMKGNLDVSIDKFIFRKMQFTELDAGVQLAPGFIKINKLTSKAMDGNIRVAGLIAFQPNNSLNLNCDISAIEMNIPEIFSQCENLGQNTLTNKHLLGTISTSIALNATWLNYKTLDENNLSAIVDFTIKNGELINFEPLKAASKFIRIEELERIRFAELSNTIKIANRRFDIPEFEIKSSALNLIIFGYHSFDNIVDYHFKINLHKLLAQKFRRKTTEFQYIEPDPYEGLNIFLSMTGPIDNPTIKFDKGVTRNKVKEDFKREKEELKNLFSNAPKKVDENEKKREDKYFNTTEQPTFIDFPDE